MHDVLKEIERFPFGSVEDIVGPGGLVVLAPHPDDETLGCGGLLAAAAALGRPATVVVITDGSGSHPNSRIYPPTRLSALRGEEARCAVRALGLSADQVAFLGLKDTAAPTDGEAFETAVARIVAIIHDIGATAILSTWRHDPHCDHEATAAIADAVLARVPGLRGWAYPIWGLHRRANEDLGVKRPKGLRFDISPYLERKRAALACHASQMTTLIDDDPEAFRLSDAHLAPFLAPFERFLEVRP